MATPEEQRQTMLDNLPEKTGKPLNDWLSLVTEQSLSKHGEIVKFLKAEHQVTHGFANLIAHCVLNPAEAQPADLVSQQYDGAKASLRPIYDAIITRLQAAAPDMEIAPKKTYVSLRAKKQFAIVQPSTKTRIDIGLNLKDEPPTDRLEVAGSFNAMVSHRVRITTLDDIDDELITWLSQAYSLAN